MQTHRKEPGGEKSGDRGGHNPFETIRYRENRNIICTQPPVLYDYVALSCRFAKTALAF
jgi:hypothetical protein